MERELGIIFQAARRIEQGNKHQGISARPLPASTAPFISDTCTVDALEDGTIQPTLQPPCVKNLPFVLNNKMFCCQIL
jgi:hypothetical protein